MEIIAHFYKFTAVIFQLRVYDQYTYYFITSYDIKSKTNLFKKLIDIKNEMYLYWDLLENITDRSLHDSESLDEKKKTKSDTTEHRVLYTGIDRTVPQVRPHNDRNK